LIKESNSYLLKNSQIWAEVTNGLGGEFMYGGNTSFMSSQYGKLTQNKITSHCREIFGAKPNRDRTNRGYLFDKEKLDRLGQFYNLNLQLNIADEVVTDVTDVTVSGYVDLNRIFQNSTSNPENKHDEIQKTNPNNEENREGDIRKPSQPSQPSQPSP
jgi:hypothetical protein